MPKQILEDLELLHRQLERLSRPGDLARHEVHFQVLVLELEHLIRASAAEERADACEQLRDGEWLHEVVVGSAVEPAHAIAHRVLGGEDKHGRLQPALEYGRQDHEPTRKRVVTCKGIDYGGWR